MKTALLALGYASILASSLLATVTFLKIVLYGQANYYEPNSFTAYIELLVAFFGILFILYGIWKEHKQ